MNERAPERVELPPEGPSTFGLWALVLGGPVVWILHFGVVYLAAEASCAAVDSDHIEFFGTAALEVWILVATGLAALATLVTALYSWRSARRGDGDTAALGTVGVLVSLGSLAAVLAVGLPAAAIDLC